jgi:U3 small nucleolar ribonucleoprotein protein IMP3
LLEVPQDANSTQRLLRKVDFVTWPSDNSHREQEVINRYRIQQRDDYKKYNQLCGQLRQMAHKLSLLSPTDPFRRKHEDLLLEKLFDVLPLVGRAAFFG